MVFLFFKKTRKNLSQSLSHIAQYENVRNFNASLVKDGRPKVKQRRKCSKNKRKKQKSPLYYERILPTVNYYHTKSV